VAAAESLGKKMSAGWQTDKVRLLVDTLERLPIDWVARVLLLVHHVNVPQRPGESVEQHKKRRQDLARKLERVLTSPDIDLPDDELFWEAFVTRCFPRITKLPDDMTAFAFEHQPQPGEELQEEQRTHARRLYMNRMWRIFAARIFNAVASLEFAISSYVGDEQEVTAARPPVVVRQPLAPELGAWGAFDDEVRAGMVCTEVFGRAYTREVVLRKGHKNVFRELGDEPWSPGQAKVGFYVASEGVFITNPWVGVSSTQEYLGLQAEWRIEAEGSYEMLGNPTIGSGFSDVVGFDADGTASWEQLMVFDQAFAHTLHLRYAAPREWVRDALFKVVARESVQRLGALDIDKRGGQTLESLEAYVQRGGRFWRHLYPLSAAASAPAAVTGGRLGDKVSRAWRGTALALLSKRYDTRQQASLGARPIFNGDIVTRANEEMRGPTLEHGVRIDAAGRRRALGLLKGLQDALKEANARAHILVLEVAPSYFWDRMRHEPASVSMRIYDWLVRAGAPPAGREELKRLFLSDYFFALDEDANSSYDVAQLRAGKVRMPEFLRGAPRAFRRVYRQYGHPSFALAVYIALLPPPAHRPNDPSTLAIYDTWEAVQRHEPARAVAFKDSHVVSRGEIVHIANYFGPVVYTATAAAAAEPDGSAQAAETTPAAMYWDAVVAREQEARVERLLSDT
jgi:hypothetical protein